MSGARKRLPRAKTVQAIHYSVSMPDPASHVFHVEITLPGDCTLAFPAWTPGSYKIREFGKNVSSFKAHGGAFELLDKQRYRLSGAAKISYDYYADELSVRSPHLDDSHGFFLGTNLFPYVEGDNGLPLKLRHEVSIQPAQGWKVATSLPRKGDVWFADDYDILGDTPFEIGTHEVRSFRVRGVKHDIAFYGYGNYDTKRIAADTAKIVEAQARNFGGLPYDYYLFIHHMTPGGGGGLEHLNSCVCAWGSWKFAKYYERIWCSRARVCKPQAVLDSFAETVEREDSRPGRLLMSLEQSSWLAWTKLYMADENFLNSGVSYYARGAQVGLLLDAKIRSATDGKRSLDDVMKLAFKRYGWPKPGFEEGTWEALCEEVAGRKFTKFWRDHVKGTRELDYTDFLETYGLEFSRDKQGNVPWLGFTAAKKGTALQITTVHADGPGREAGLQPRDELLALNGYKVDDKSLEDRIKELKPGSTCTLALFRRETLVNSEVLVGRQPAGKLQLRPRKKLTPAQKRNLKKWLG
jgi:predicted metalloprotease with PDZ domain